MAGYARRKAPARGGKRSSSRARAPRRTAVRSGGRSSARRTVTRRPTKQRQQTIRIVLETAATSQVARPDISPEALTGAQVEAKRGKAKL